MFAEAKIGERPSEPGVYNEDKNVSLHGYDRIPCIYLFLHMPLPLLETFLEIINIRKKAFFKLSAFAKMFERFIGINCLTTHRRLINNERVLSLTVFIV